MAGPASDTDERTDALDPVCGSGGGRGADGLDMGAPDLGTVPGDGRGTYGFGVAGSASLANSGPGIAYKRPVPLGALMAFPPPVPYTKGAINRAGDGVRNGKFNLVDMVVINMWRAAHAYILNTFQAMHRNRTRDTTIVVAQRHKRMKTIYGKLRRQPKMELARMDDVAGCRLIFETCGELYEYRRKFLAARHGHKRRNSDDKYDYLKKPKSDGYRGIHDIYEYNTKSRRGEPYNGLLLELQYRTIYQHAWATSVEVVGLVTENQPKFDAGDERYKEFFRLASEIIARVYEDSRSCYSDISNPDLIARFLALENEIGLLKMLKGLNVANKEILASKNVILVFTEEGSLDVLTFFSPGEAMEKYFELEQRGGKNDIVLVRADTGEDIRTAFRNYFSDTVDFVNFIEEGIKVLWMKNE